MLIIASTNGSVGIRQAVKALKNNQSVVDAVETGIHPVEDNEADSSVGYGGLPNILGEVELDASIMEGEFCKSGAVGCLKGYRHPISVARKVMESLPHVFLVGSGADRFAEESDCEKRDMLSPQANQTWLAAVKNCLPNNIIDNLKHEKNLAHWVKILSDPRHSKGTVNFIARDNAGNLCVGVSTSGWFGKYPGRLGDSPVIGAGSYADNRYGAAACTGMGEMAIRAGTTRSVVLYLKMGFSLREAGIQAMKDLDDLGGDYLSDMNIVAVDQYGNHAGFTNTQGKTYIYMTGDMAEPIESERVFVETHKTWLAEEELPSQS